MLEVFLLIVSVVLIILPISDWTASYILNKAYNKASTSNIALKERSRVAIILAIAATLNGFIALNRLVPLHIENTLVVIALAISLILVSVPNLYWLWLYYRNRLRKG